jgi:hypothetical protein
MLNRFESSVLPGVPAAMDFLKSELLEQGVVVPERSEVLPGSAVVLRSYFTKQQGDAAAEESAALLVVGADARPAPAALVRYLLLTLDVRPLVSYARKALACIEEGEGKKLDLWVHQTTGDDELELDIDALVVTVKVPRQLFGLLKIAQEVMDADEDKLQRLHAKMGPDLEGELAFARDLVHMRAQNAESEGLAQFIWAVEDLDELKFVKNNPAVQASPNRRPILALVELVTSKLDLSPAARVRVDGLLGMAVANAADASVGDVQVLPRGNTGGSITERLEVAVMPHLPAALEQVTAELRGLGVALRSDAGVIARVESAIRDRYQKVQESGRAHTELADVVIGQDGAAAPAALVRAVVADALHRELGQTAAAAEELEDAEQQKVERWARTQTGIENVEVDYDCLVVNPEYSAHMLQLLRFSKRVVEASSEQLERLIQQAEMLPETQRDFVRDLARARLEDRDIGRVIESVWFSEDEAEAEAVANADALKNHRHGPPVRFFALIVLNKLRMSPASQERLARQLDQCAA